MNWILWFIKKFHKSKIATGLSSEHVKTNGMNVKFSVNIY